MRYKLFIRVEDRKVFRVLEAGKFDKSQSACIIYTDHPDNRETWVSTHGDFFDGKFQEIGYHDEFEPLKDIKEFHERFGLSYDDCPRSLPEDISDFRYKFLKEEVEEWYLNQNLAFDETTRDLMSRSVSGYTTKLSEALDGLVDLAYVLFGTSYLHGFNNMFAEAWSRVHRANMSKIRAKKESDSKRGSTFDVVKPEGWKPPCLLDLVSENDIHHNHKDRA